MTRQSKTSTVTVVEHRCAPMGRSRENGPHLSDLRAFVAECEGLPDDLRVFVDNGHMNEAGRYMVTFRVRHAEEAGDLNEPQAAPDEVAS